jgi:hypothetical protein
MFIFQTLCTLGLAAVALYVIYVYGILPLKVRGKNLLTIDVDLAPTTVEDLNETARQGIARAVRDLIPLGFVVVANFKQVRTMASADVIQVLLVHREHGNVGLGHFGGLWTGQRYLQAWTLAFSTRLTSGAMLRTFASKNPTAFPENPRIDSLNIPWLTDGRMLYAVHRARVEQWDRPGGGDVVLPSPGREREHLLEAIHRQHQWMVDIGYHRPDPATGVYVRTLKGTYLLSWRLLWPLKGMRLRARERRARRALRELGFAEWAEGGRERRDNETISSWKA